MSNSGITYSLNGQVAELHMDDGKVNAISPGVLGALQEGLDRAEKEAQAILLLGRPGCFSAGFDLKTLGQGTGPARALAGAGAEFLLRLMGSPLPVVAGCTGHALALGALVLLASDRRIGAAGSFKLGLNEVAIGVTLPRFAVELAQERLSQRHRLRVALLAETLDPNEALDAGLLDEVVPPGSLQQEAYDRATRLAELPRPAFQETKRRLRSGCVERARRGLARDFEDFGG